MSYSETGRRRHTAAWEAVRAARKARRAQDPDVQARRRQHEAREAHKAKENPAA